MSLVAATGTGASVSNAKVAVSGAESTTVPCAGTCTVFGPAGTYHIVVSATGFGSYTADTPSA